MPRHPTADEFKVLRWYIHHHSDSMTLSVHRLKKAVRNFKKVLRAELRRVPLLGRMI